ncbi:hypothetical protein BMW24_022980 [Mycobacterium heckeshornense]|uniref:Uncharacterized protein n=1 Tax=Mycobacterium heckeshornense TaxID=110505 RepID=A0A2G8AVF9_9MYCO|nr:hypothetical protein ACT16_06120 [Mycobacterium heckeshornense]PIJ29467.1 hypothetical protein BMW24_022980 [Mycobacterium heckeshornense]BCO35502.1 hypothetical protein MHEC_19350 [Mycobacterium heckeshornense]
MSDHHRRRTRRREPDTDTATAAPAYELMQAYRQLDLEITLSDAISTLDHPAKKIRGEVGARDPPPVTVFSPRPVNSTFLEGEVGYATFETCCAATLFGSFGNGKR